MDASSVVINASFNLSNQSSVSNNLYIKSEKKIVKELIVEMDKQNTNFLLFDDVNKPYIHSINDTIFFENIYGMPKKNSSKNITIGLKFSDFKESQKEAQNMKDHLNGVKSAENGLFIVGIFTGLFILSSIFIADVPLYNAIPASLFGFGAMIPKIRGILNDK